MAKPTPKPTPSIDPKRSPQRAAFELAQKKAEIANKGKVPQKQPGKDPYRQYKSPGKNGFSMNLPKG